MTSRPIEITQGDDPRLEVFRDVRDKDLRGRRGSFMAESELVVRRLLARPERVSAVLLSRSKYGTLALDLAVLPADVPVYVADVATMTEIAGFHVHRGVLAAGHRPSRQTLTLDAALGHLRGRPRVTLLVAEALTNVDNMGGLFRNAAGFGADGIVLDPSCCDPLYRKAIRVSMGHVFTVPYAVSSAWPHDLERLRSEWGVTLVAAESTRDAVPLWAMPRTPRTAFLFGSEGQGIGAPALARCDAVCRIPMRSNVPSINVAHASAVFLYERMRPADEGGAEPRDS